VQEKATPQGVFAKARKRSFAGVWGVPNKQSKPALAGAASGQKYPKGYSCPLLADEIGSVCPACFQQSSSADSMEKMQNKKQHTKNRGISSVYENDNSA